MSIHREATIPADPAHVYQVLADAEALSALADMSGVPAHAAGGEFTAFDGRVTGRQVALMPDERIVHRPRGRRRARHE